MRKQLESTKASDHVKSASLKSQLDNLFIEAIKVAHTLLDADRGTLWLVDDQTNELWTRIAEGMDPIRIPKSKGIVGWVATTGDTLNIEDAYVDPRFNNAVDKKTGYKTTQILCVPIFSSTSGKVIGVIQLINKVARSGNSGSPLKTIKNSGNGEIPTMISWSSVKDLSCALPNQMRKY